MGDVAHRTSGRAHEPTIEISVGWKHTAPDDVPPAPQSRAATPRSAWEYLKMLWPAVTLLGFLFLTAFVIAMGTQSTARYEREQRAAATSGRATAEPVGAARTA
jgi:hypothetical protein